LLKKCPGIGKNIMEQRSNIERFNKQLSFIIEIDKLKQVLRRTILMDSSRRENDAEHMWHMAVGAMLFAEYSNNSKELDILKVLKMAVLHDIVEVYAGDTFAYDEKGHLDKEEREKKSADKIFGLLPAEQGSEFRNLWEEFEAAMTIEAKYARAIDRFMPILHNYITKGKQWHNFGVTSDKVLAKNKTIEEGSEFLWEYVKHMVEDGIKKGYFPEQQQSQNHNQSIRMVECEA
jgi:putative hydrolase of HD superfamily